MDDQLRSAIDAQYAAFQVAAPRTVDGCPCCSTPAELHALVSTPRDRLSAEQLEFYAFSGLLTVGDVTDLRHYWPRLAELSISGELLADAEVVFAKPRHGDWRSWPEAEQEALVALACAQIESLAAHGLELDDYAVETWVCAFGQFLEDATAILSPLLRPEPGPAAALRGWYTLNERCLARGQLWDAFWESRPSNVANICRWFATSEVQAAIDRAFSPPGAPDR